MSECNQDCSACSSACGEQAAPGDMTERPHPESRVKRVVAVMSGKGGVGKSTVTALLAASMRRAGYRAAVLDADITGPSIPRMFGLTERPGGGETGILPVQTKNGVAVISLNLLMENESDPVIWRGPVVAGVVTQFWKDVIWGDVDYMFVDMPPGTGDVPLTVFQSLPVDGVILVTSPQELVSMIVGKAVNMARMMDIPVLGVIENYSYFLCPDCKREHAVFGESRLEQAAEKMGVRVLGRLPIEPALARAGDAGALEDAAPPKALDDMAERIRQALPPERG